MQQSTKSERSGVDLPTVRKDSDLTMTMNTNTTCEKCGYDPIDYNFHKACHDYLDHKISEQEYQAALTAAPDGVNLITEIPSE